MSFRFALVLTALAAQACVAGDVDSDGDDPGVEELASSTKLHLFDPASYPGYDATGGRDTTAAFQRAIDAASDYASAHKGDPVGAGLYRPDPIERNGVNLGPTGPQAVVRTSTGVFLLDRLALKSNVRLEIDAGATLIPVEAVQQVIIELWPTEGREAYLENVTISAHGSSSTFRDTGRRCKAAGMPSPCSLPKTVQYKDMTFPDGSTLAAGDPAALTLRFTVDLDYRRYPASQKTIGDAPRGSGIKARAVKHFLVERMLELAYPGEVRDPNDDPPGPGGIGSNTWPATAGNGIAVGAMDTPVDLTANAVQPRNGTFRYLHCENCTRGYGIAEIHAGVDLDYSYMSTRGGIAVRWESAGNGRSTRQTAREVVGMDCNTPLLMSTHDRTQTALKASFVKAVGCDAGFRSESAGGTNTGSSVSDFFIYPGGVDGDAGGKAQVIVCRGGKDLTGCARYGVPRYDDDAWTWKPATQAINNDLGVSTARMYCIAKKFALPNDGANCSAFPGQ